MTKERTMTDDKILDYDLKLSVINDGDIPKIAKIADALGDEKRLKILKALSSSPRPIEINELVASLSIPKTTLLHHLKKLESAQIISFLYSSGNRGTVKKTARSLHSLKIQIVDATESTAENKRKTLYQTQSARPGTFTDFEGDIFNFATSDKFFQSHNDDCFQPERYDAELIFAPNGIITYKFSNYVARTHTIKELSFSMELCSEAPYFDMAYKSDITFWINDKELFTYTLDGDYGDRRGRLNPPWWPSVNTQYGKLLTVTVSDSGVTLCGKQVESSVTLKDLNLDRGNYLQLKFGNKPTALNAGGFNLFGANFGDHPQDVKLSFCYE